MTSFQPILPLQSQNTAYAHIIQSDAEALEIAKNLAEQFKQQAIQRDAERILPFEEIETYSQSGLWAITVPKEFGGADVSKLYGRANYRTNEWCRWFDWTISQNHFYALEVLRNNGTEQQKRKLYAEVLKGARFGNALAEFKTKNATQKQTALSQTEQGYVVNGEKFYCTGSLFADRIPTLVKDADDKEFLVFIPRSSPGLELIDDWSGFGQRTTGSGTVKFNHVAVDAEDIVPFDTAFSRPTLVGPFAQIMHAAIETGIARAAFEETLVRVRQARPWIDSAVEQATDDP